MVGRLVGGALLLGILHTQLSILDALSVPPPPAALDEARLEQAIEEAVLVGLADLSFPEPAAADCPTVERVEREEADEEIVQEAFLLVDEAVADGFLSEAVRADLRVIAPSLSQEDLGAVLASIADAVNTGQIEPPEVPGVFL